MEYILVLITVFAGAINHEYKGTYTSMNDCFDAREKIIKEKKRPIVNYQAVCILSENKFNI